MAQGCTCIANSLDKMDIYMKSTKICKIVSTSQMHESSKLDILVHQMNTNERSSTNIYKGLFVAH